MKKWILIFIICAAFGVQVLNGQNYKTGIGIRVSPLYGITLKHFTSPQKAIELILSSRWNGAQIAGLYEVHTTGFKHQPLQIYAGIGGQLSIWRDGRYNPWYERGFFAWGRTDWDFYERNRDPDRGRVALGMDMIIGMEYTIKDLPLVLGLDWKPQIILIGGNSIFVDDVGLSVRFTF